MIRTVTSSQGGVFSILVDDFNTTAVIDTYSGPDQPLPLCYPMQFPPFIVPPPTLALQNNHTIKLVYMGPSPNAPSNSTGDNGQFDSFAIPTFSEMPSQANEAVERGKTNRYIFILLAMLFLFSIGI